MKGTPSIAERDRTSRHVTSPADFWHTTSHILSDRSSIHGIDTWLIACRGYCQPFPPSNLPVVSLCSRHSWASPHRIRNSMNLPCSIHIQFHGLNFESSTLVQLLKQDSIWNRKQIHLERTDIFLPHRTICASLWFLKNMSGSGDLYEICQYERDVYC